jgi:hypothetical protein
MKVRPDQKNIKLFSTAVALLKHVKTWQEKSGDFLNLISDSEDKFVSDTQTRFLYKDTLSSFYCIGILFSEIMHELLCYSYN